MFMLDVVDGSCQVLGEKTRSTLAKKLQTYFLTYFLGGILLCGFHIQYDPLLTLIIVWFTKKIFSPSLNGVQLSIMENEFLTKCYKFDMFFSLIKCLVFIILRDYCIKV